MSAAMVEMCPDVSHQTCRPQRIKALYTANRQSHPTEVQTPHANMKLFIPFDVYAYDDFDDTDVDFSFMLEESLNYPSYLCKCYIAAHL